MDTIDLYSLINWPKVAVLGALFLFGPVLVYLFAMKRWAPAAPQALNRFHVAQIISMSVCFVSAVISHDATVFADVGRVTLLTETFQLTVDLTRYCDAQRRGVHSTPDQYPWIAGHASKLVLYDDVKNPIKKPYDPAKPLSCDPSTLRVDSEQMVDQMTRLTWVGGIANLVMWLAALASFLFFLTSAVPHRRLHAVDASA